MRRLRHALEAAFVYAAYGLFSVLPLERASELGGLIARAIGPFLPSSKTALVNLMLAFPEKSAWERRNILDGMWDNLGRVFAEYAHLDRIWDHVEMNGVEHLKAAQDGTAPAIFFTAHLANWEVCPISARQHGVEMHTVYRRPNNLFVDWLLRRARHSGSAGLIRKGNQGARDMLAVMRKGGALGVMMDQRLGEGVSVPFFGHPAMTAPAVAVFGLRFGARIYPARTERLGRTARFRVTVLPPLPVTETGDHDRDVRDVLQRINAVMEEWIRARPEQWLWIHQRWSV